MRALGLIFHVSFTAYIHAPAHHLFSNSPCIFVYVSEFAKEQFTSSMEAGNCLASYLSLSNKCCSFFFYQLCQKIFFVQYRSIPDSVFFGHLYFVDHKSNGANFLNQYPDHRSHHTVDNHQAPNAQQKPFTC